MKGSLLKVFFASLIFSSWLIARNPFNFKETISSSSREKKVEAEAVSAQPDQLTTGSDWTIQEATPDELIMKNKVDGQIRKISK